MARSHLDGGADGLDFYRAIVAQAPGHLTPAGWLLFEVGAGQAPDVLFTVEEGISLHQGEHDSAPRSEVSQPRARVALPKYLQLVSCIYLLRAGVKHGAAGAPREPEGGIP